MLSCRLLSSALRGICAGRLACRRSLQTFRLLQQPSSSAGQGFLEQSPDELGFASQVHSSYIPTMSTATTSSTTTPLKRLALHSTVTCAAQANQYGKCILTTYTDVRKDACKEEFANFGACLREAVSCIMSRTVQARSTPLDEAQVVTFARAEKAKLPERRRTPNISVGTIPLDIIV